MTYRSEGSRSAKREAIMRRILFGPGALVLGLAALMSTTSPVTGGKGGRGGGGHAAPAHVGSVHYASRPAPARIAPARVAPAARAATVRSEHYAGSAHYAGAAASGAYRNPYSGDYFRHFRPGYRSFLIGDASYYYYDDLPSGYQTVVIDGITYYLYDGVYYQAYLYGGQTVYMIVPTQ
jgi:hypothetical protein